MDERPVSLKDSTSLRQVLRTVTGAQPTRTAVRAVVARCHRMARAYLRQQQQTGALREDVLGEDVDDLAMDAIAGLFERDDKGRFPELQQYFSDRDLSDVGPTEVEQALRRLVLGAVTDWLFEAYRSADRSLSNLLRALKRVAREHDGVQVVQRGKTRWLEVLSPSSSSENRDAARSTRSARGRRMPIETLEAHLTSIFTENPTTEELLDEAVATLRAHPGYESAYPLTRLAQAMRAARVRVQTVTEHHGGVTRPDDPLFRSEEVETQIEKSLTRLRKEKRATYVEDGPLSEGTYAAYIQALRDRLEARFVPPGDADMTHHEALAAHLDDLSRGEYREHHRARFEYLDRCAREILVERLRAAM